LLRAIGFRAACLRGDSASIARRSARSREAVTTKHRCTDIVELARRYGRKIAELLRRAGWLVNDKRVERIWQRVGLKVPARQHERGRLWLNDRSCIRPRAERPNHAWSCDFLEERTHDGRKIRLPNITASSPTSAGPFGVSQSHKLPNFVATLAGTALRFRGNGGITATAL
jgi:putative transposase